jgi:exodeoxyribonuclease-5
MQWSPQQEQALKEVRLWLRDRSGPQVYYLAGFAGTGKTTLATELAGSVRGGKVLFAAYTGKAALVLQSKGCAGASTIHSLIYRIEDEDAAEPRFVLNREDSPLRDANLLIVDEVSMVGEEIGMDLLSFRKKILVLGDPFQLPPVSGEGFFTRNAPNLTLTEVHRQARDNPIIRMSMDIREGRRLQAGSFGESEVIARSAMMRGHVKAADQVIVGLNKTRRTFNGRIREMQGRAGAFQIGDRVISLKNNREKGLLNGALWTVDSIQKQGGETTEMVVTPLDAGMIVAPVAVRCHHAWLEGREKELPPHVARGFDPFDFAYAITCHKAQGSQWDRVLVMDEGSAFQEMRDRWLYTAATRAAKSVTIVRG